MFSRTMGRDAEDNALERVARLEQENAELKRRIGRIRAGESPHPERASTLGALAIVRVLVLLVATGVSLRFAISATRAERSASDAQPPPTASCEEAP